MAVRHRSMFRNLVFLGLALAYSSVGRASLETTGTWEAGVWATTTWADGVWREGATSTYGGAAEILLIIRDR